jgi:hypothetical protein
VVLSAVWFARQRKKEQSVCQCRKQAEEIKQPGLIGASKCTVSVPERGEKENATEKNKWYHLAASDP